MTGVSILLGLVADLLCRRVHVRLQWWASRPRHVVASLLLLGAWVTFYGYEFAPPHSQADVWNAGGAAGRLLLLVLVVLAHRAWSVSAAAVWWAVEDLQVLGCTVLWLVQPWQMQPGEMQCSAAIGVPLSLAGLSLGALVAWVVFRATVQEPRNDTA